jgi:hypothetical protein
MRVTPAGLVHIPFEVKVCVDTCLPPAAPAALVISPISPDDAPVVPTIPVI